MLPENIKGSLSKQVKETNKQILSQSLGFMSSAFALVAALAWNDAIRALLQRYFHESSGLISSFIYAILVTVVAVIITMRLNKIAERLNTRGEQS